MRAKYTAGWGVQIVGIIFQTRSNPKNKACIPAAGSHIIYILCQQSENTGFSFLFYASRITPLGQASLHAPHPVHFS
ncbi:DUF6783 domain-containing protein [Ruminococcus sp. 1001136sp1]|uniref:DUF6783 domain-containing protein n=1 Tax=Ruminococcus sp. 1001136sp1 TaxID=2986996 RepID=UPI003FA71633